jgi:ferredoxin
MKVKIDYGLCMGDGNCHKVCPEVFDYDDDKLRGVVRNPAVPKHLEAKVRQAAEECNPQAIEIEE